MKKNESGFTLVEMGIVVVIIALLVGGVLKGREVLGDAQITSVVATIKSIDMAVKGFVELYAYLPGDIPAAPGPAAVVPSCSGTCATNGDGDFYIDNAAGNNNLGTAPASGSEGHVAFLQLAAAGLFSGINSFGTPTFGSGLPKAAVGGGFWLGASPTAAGLVLLQGTLQSGNYLVLNGTVTNVSTTSGRLSAEQIAQIDLKMDDGLPGGGTIRGAGAGACSNAGAYVRTDINKRCTIYARILN